jgi:hypothetical protein
MGFEYGDFGAKQSEISDHMSNAKPPDHCVCDYKRSPHLGEPTAYHVRVTKAQKQQPIQHQ